MARGRGQRRPFDPNKPRVHGPPKPKLRGKVCPHCDVRSETVRGGYCGECLPGIATAWSTHVSAPSVRQTLSRYNMTTELHAELFAHQRGLCAICRDPARSAKNDGNGGLVVDHNHETGQVRALLCSRCNTAIGLLGENVEWMTRAADYVTRSERIADGKAKRSLRKLEERAEQMAQTGPVPDHILAAIEKLTRRLELQASLPKAR